LKDDLVDEITGQIDERHEKPGREFSWDWTPALVVAWLLGLGLGFALGWEWGCRWGCRMRGGLGLGQLL